MNDKEQLDCQLDCKATAGLREQVMKDMAQEDRPLKELLDEQEKAEDNESVTN